MDTQQKNALGYSITAVGSAIIGCLLCRKSCGAPTSLVEVSNLQVVPPYPSMVYVGEPYGFVFDPVEITCTVVNLGEEEDNFGILCQVGNEILSQEVSLLPGLETEITFQYQPPPVTEEPAQGKLDLTVSIYAFGTNGSISWTQGG